MKIIQELPSYNGRIRINEINGITRVNKADNQTIKGAELPQWVIWCSLPGGSYPIAHFPNSRKRDECFEYIVENDSSIIILEYNKFFTDAILTDKQVEGILKSNNMLFQNHIKNIITKLIESGTEFVALQDLDAFKDFSINHLQRWREGIPLEIDEVRASRYTKIWAKCLYTPLKYVNMGITPLQFYHNLIKLNNEKIKATRPTGPDNSGW